MNKYKEQWKRVFPERLKFFLEMRNMTQGELAAKAGLTEASMSRYANANRIPKITTVCALADALDVTVASLYVE